MRPQCRPGAGAAGGSGTAGGADRPGKSKIWSGAAAPVLAQKAGTAAAPSGGGGGGGRRGRAGGARRAKASPGNRVIRRSKAGEEALPASPVRRVRMGGETVYVHEATFQSDEDPDSADDPYTVMPGGGNQEAEDLLAEAGAFATRNDFKGACRLYKEVLARFPNHYIANHNMGTTLQVAGKPRSATRYFARAIMVWPEHHVAYSGMGRALLDMKQYSAALGMFEKSLEIQPDDPLSLEGRSKALRALGGRGRR